jgi:hypothetical protein
MTRCEDCTSKQAVKKQMIKYGFHAPDMTVTEFVEDLLPSIQLKDTCDDAISRQAVLAIAGDSCLDLGFFEDTRAFCDEINNLPSVQPEQKWIPISERLPEENGDYFVTLKNGVVTILGYSTTQRTTYPKGFYYISNGCAWRQTINFVIAWMPLPKSYQPQKSEG